MSFQKKEEALIFQKRILRKHNSSCHVGLGGVYKRKSDRFRTQCPQHIYDIL